ncbi:hypothetical protein L1887_59467 [Cichorium endivia]|nr:hypothetical protein L1887_59467 [Cichorium endivia]
MTERRTPGCRSFARSMRRRAALLQMALQGSSFRLFFLPPAPQAKGPPSSLTPRPRVQFSAWQSKEKHTVYVTLLRRLEEVQTRRKNELKSQATFCACQRALELKRSTSQRSIGKGYRNGDQDDYCKNGVVTQRPQAN